MENIQSFTNEQFGTLRCYIDDSGTAYLNIEDVARGLGFTKTEEKSSTTSGRKSYESIRWERINGYLQDFGFLQEVAKDDYIPEHIFYRLAMKAKNAAAERFQDWIASKVIPDIRKFGIYATPAAVQKILNDPDFLIQIANKLKDQQSTINRQQIQINNQALTIDCQRNTIDAQKSIIDDLTPKADYYDLILSSKGLCTTKDIAKEYGYSDVKFNQLLHELHIQFKQSGRWYLYAEYADKGWTKQVPYTYTNSKGESVTTYTMKWTQKGRIALYELLKANGILPVIEKQNLDYFPHNISKREQTRIHYRDDLGILN